MNISFEYLYRDAANYKNWGQVVLSNDCDKALDEIESLIREALIDGEFFVAERVNIPVLYFEKYDRDLDHSWHVFSTVGWTDMQPSTSLKFSEFVQLLRQANATAKG